METTKVEYQEGRTAVEIKWLFFILFSLIKIISFGQSTSPIIFQYNNPRNGKPESASIFLSDFGLRSTSHNSECYYAMGWYRFRVVQTGVIDSVSFCGDIYAELKMLGERSIRESQVYWKCSDCKKSGGHWFTIPVLVDFTTASQCQPNPVYRQQLAFWQKLFESQPSDQLSIGRNEWLLAPMHASAFK